MTRVPAGPGQPGRRPSFPERGLSTCLCSHCQGSYLPTHPGRRLWDWQRPCGKGCPFHRPSPGSPVPLPWAPVFRKTQSLPPKLLRERRTQKERDRASVGHPGVCLQNETHSGCKVLGDTHILPTAQLGVSEHRLPPYSVIV